MYKENLDNDEELIGNTGVINNLKKKLIKYQIPIQEF